MAKSGRSSPRAQNPTLIRRRTMPNGMETSENALAARRSGGRAQMIHKSREQAAAVGPAHRGFHTIFRMRHHAEHIAALVDNAGDGVHGAIVIPVGVD